MEFPSVLTVVTTELLIAGGRWLIGATMAALRAEVKGVC
uniref:Uncharacterized protein n=1 Tax=Amphimedon queenslandica TaxID=400682 RepID=A0A1X7VRC6_AMPQE